MAQPGKAFYTGLFRHTLDDKSRLTIPSAWRAAHGEAEAFLATPHPDGYIAVLPPAEVEKLHAKIAQMALSDGAGQDFVARFFSQTQSFSFDKAGRIGLNHSRGLKVSSGLKAGRIGLNHNRGLKVSSGLKAGRLATNHNRALRG